jgi:hypothetical protein
MNFDHCKMYWEPAALALRDVLPVVQSHQIEIRLEIALGCSVWSEYARRTAHDDFPLSEDWIVLLQKLAGPHGRAILKAYQIKNGISP